MITFENMFKNYTKTNSSSIFLHPHFYFPQATAVAFCVFPLNYVFILSKGFLPVL